MTADGTKFTIPSRSQLDPVALLPNTPVDVRTRISKGYPDPEQTGSAIGKTAKAKGAGSKVAPGSKATPGSKAATPFKITVLTPMFVVLQHADSPGAQWLASRWAVTIKHHPGLVPEKARAAATELADNIKAGKWSAAKAAVAKTDDQDVIEFLSQRTAEFLVMASKSATMAEAIINKDQLWMNSEKAQELRDNLDKALGGDQAARKRITDAQWATGINAWHTLPVDRTPDC